MHFFILLVFMGNFLTSAQASEHPFPTEKTSVKKQKLQHQVAEKPGLSTSSSQQVIGESELLRRVGVLAKEFHQSVEEDVKIPLEQPCFPKKEEGRHFYPFLCENRQLNSYLRRWFNS